MPREWWQQLHFSLPLNISSPQDGSPKGGLCEEGMHSSTEFVLTVNGMRHQATSLLEAWLLPKRAALQSVPKQKDGRISPLQR